MEEGFKRKDKKESKNGEFNENNNKERLSKDGENRKNI